MKLTGRLGLTLLALLLVGSLGRGQQAFAADKEPKAIIAVDEGAALITDPTGKTHSLEAGEAVEYSAGAIRLASKMQSPASADDWQEILQKQLGKEVSVNFQQLPLRKVLTYLQNTANINIILDTRNRDVDHLIPITLNLQKVSLGSVLRWVVRLAKLEYVIRDEAIFLTTPKRIPVEWKEDIDKREALVYGEALKSWMPKLEAGLWRPVTFDFAGIGGYEALDFLRNLTQTNIVIDPEAEAVHEAVMLRVTKMSLKNALVWLTKQLDASYVLMDEAVFVTRRAKAEQLRALQARLEMRMKFKKLITLELTEHPAEEALKMVGKLANLKVELNGKLPADARVTLPKTALPVDKVVNEIMKQAGARGFLIGYKGDSITIWVREQQAPATTPTTPAAPWKWAKPGAQAGEKEAEPEVEVPEQE